MRVLYHLKAARPLLSASSMLPDTATGLVKAGVSENGSSLMFQRKDGWSWKQITWKDFEIDVKSAAAFLADGGFGAGDRAFFEPDCAYRGLVAETAVLMLGGVAVWGRAPDGVAPPKIAFTKTRAGAETAVSEGAEKAFFHSGGSGKPEGPAVSFQAALKFGFLKSRKMTDFLENAFSSVRGDIPAVEFHEAGKARVFSQAAFMEMLGSAAKNAADALNGNSQTFCCVSGSGIFSFAVKFLPLCVSARAAAAENEDDIFDDILEIMPTVAFFDSARLEGIAVCAPSQPGGAKRSAFGGRLKHIFTDSPLSQKAADFYANLGIRVCSETLP